MTICAKGKDKLFGEIVAAEVSLNTLGHIVTQCWLALPRHFPSVLLDEWILMPNHLHGIIEICGGAMHPAILDESLRRTCTGDASPPLDAVVQNFKSISTHRITAERGTPRSAVWQRDYYEDSIGNEDSLNYNRDYIVNNPAQWECDSENPGTRLPG